MNPRLIAFAPLAILLAVILAFLSLLTRGEPELDDPMVGQPFPRLELAALQGRPLFNPAEAPPAGPALVNIWASWCTPCLAEHPYLMALADEGVAIYGIDYKERRAGAGEAFLARHGSPFAAVGADPRGRMGLELGITGVPETYVVDGGGVIVARHVGPLTEQTVRETIRPALREAAAGAPPPGS